MCHPSLKEGVQSGNDFLSFDFERMDDRFIVGGDSDDPVINLLTQIKRVNSQFRKQVLEVRSVRCDYCYTSWEGRAAYKDKDKCTCGYFDLPLREFRQSFNRWIYQPLDTRDLFTAILSINGRGEKLLSLSFWDMNIVLEIIDKNQFKLHITRPHTIF